MNWTAQIRVFPKNNSQESTESAEFGKHCCKKEYSNLHATSVPHLIERILKFILIHTPVVFRFPGDAEFSESLFHFGKTPLFMHQQAFKVVSLISGPRVRLAPSDVDWRDVTVTWCSLLATSRNKVPPPAGKLWSNCNAKRQG